MMHDAEMALTARVRFRNPVLSRMANGRDCLLLTEAGTWETFAGLADAFADQINAKIVSRIDGPDVRIWTLVRGVHQFRLVYDDFPNGVSLEPEDEGGQSDLLQLLERLQAESSPEGS